MAARWQAGELLDCRAPFRGISENGHARPRLHARSASWGHLLRPPELHVQDSQSAGAGSMSTLTESIAEVGVSKFLYADAMEVAQKFVAFLERFCTRIVIAGSLRRKKQL